MEGCPTRPKARGLCNKHYQRFTATGDPRDRVPAPKVICRVDDCDDPQIARRLCPKHYTRWKASGDPLGSSVRYGTMGQCADDDCDEDAVCRGYCHRHYRRLLKYGDPRGGGPFMGRRHNTLPKDASLEERFFEKVNQTVTCWLWAGAVNDKGYGLFYATKGRGRLAHRVSWLLAGRELLDGLTLDHICRVHHCVRPDHLDQVTVKVNNLRGISPWAINKRKTHCKRGHPFDEANTLVDRMGYRQCRTCVMASRAQSYVRSQAKAAAKRAARKAA